MKLAEKIVGGKVILQRPKPEMAQAETIFAHIEISRASMLPWLDWVDKVKSAQDRLNFLQYVDDCWEQGTEFSYSIFERAASRYAGHVTVLKLDFDKMSAEFGYWLSDTAVGFGYMQEAIRLLEAELHNRGFKELIIEVDRLNIRSTNVALALGYRQDKSRSRRQESVVSNRLREIDLYVKYL